MNTIIGIVLAIVGALVTLASLCFAWWAATNGSALIGVIALIPFLLGVVTTCAGVYLFNRAS